MVVAMFSWAIYSVLLKKKKHKLSQISLLEMIITMGLIFLFPIYFIEMKMGYHVILNIPFVLTLTYVVLFPSLISFLFWIKGIALIGANRSGIFLHLMPIFSALMAIIIFKEKFMFFHFMGALLILIGILLSNKKNYA
jgi:drug/metabolite transporter (DMT)-like permease